MCLGAVVKPTLHRMFAKSSALTTKGLEKPIIMPIIADRAEN